VKWLGVEDKEWIDMRVTRMRITEEGDVAVRILRMAVA